MSQTKQITEDLGKRFDVAHQARKGYKTISIQTDCVRMEEIQDHC